jgi:DNA-binding response OmpR family regulator
MKGEIKIMAVGNNHRTYEGSAGNLQSDFFNKSMQNERGGIAMEKCPCIMAVDDEPVVLMLIKRALQAGGFEVISANDGNAALELLKTHKPDLVLLDIMMPGLDGFQVLGRIRQQSNVPVIMLTGRHEVAILRDSLTTGADDFITKPFGTLELTARIRAKLRRCGRIPATARE